MITKVHGRGVRGGGRPADGSDTTTRLFRFAGYSYHDARSSSQALLQQLRRGAWAPGSVVGKGSFRGAFVAKGSDDAIRRLDDPNDHPPVLHASGTKVALVFPGLALDGLGRAMELADVLTPDIDVLEQAENFIFKTSGRSLREFLRKRLRGKGAIDQLTLPGDKAEPATASLIHIILYTFHIWITEALRVKNVVPDAVCGYSLGEYSAACASGVVPFEIGLRLLHRRSLSLQSRAEGRMLMVCASPAQVEPLLGRELFVGGFNGPNETVLSGTRAAIQTAYKQLQTQGVPCIIIDAKHAYHSPLVGLTEETLAPVLAGVPPPANPVEMISTVTGEMIAASELTRPAHWIRHLRQPVRFVAAAERLLQARPTIILEIGPPTLTPLLTRGAGNAGSPLTAAILPHRFDRRSLRDYLLSLSGQLWARGAEPLVT